MTKAEWQEAQQAEAALPVTERRIAYLPVRARTRTTLCRAISPSIFVSRGRPNWQPPTPAIIYVKDFLQWTEADLLAIHGFGRKSLEDMRGFLKANGLPEHCWWMSETDREAARTSVREGVAAFFAAFPRSSFRDKFDGWVH